MWQNWSCTCQHCQGIHRAHICAGTDNHMRQFPAHASSCHFDPSMHCSCGCHQWCFRCLLGWLVHQLRSYNANHHCLNDRYFYFDHIHHGHNHHNHHSQPRHPDGGQVWRRLSGIGRHRCTQRLQPRCLQESAERGFSLTTRVCSNLRSCTGLWSNRQWIVHRT